MNGFKICKSKDFTKGCMKLRHVFIDSSFICLSISSSFRLKSLTIFVYIFYVFLTVSPFLETSELRKSMQELERNLSALRDYSVGVILNH